VAPIPKEKIEEISAQEKKGELEEAAQDLTVLQSNDTAAESEVDEEETDEDEDAFFDNEVGEGFCALARILPEFSVTYTRNCVVFVAKLLSWHPNVCNLAENFDTR
jgi:hypothetical protein